MKLFKPAEWSLNLKVTTAISVIALILSTIVPYFLLSKSNQNIITITIASILPLIAIPITLAFTIKGYAVNKDQIIINRLASPKVINIKNITKIYKDPSATKDSSRNLGIGGMFVYSGIFNNKQLGNYEIYATNTEKSVVIIENQRTTIISPENPDEFINFINYQKVKYV